jgi:hypothetical protein
MSSPEEPPLRGVSDFHGEVTDKGEEAVRSELALPDVDTILKDLQRQHGVRVSLSPKLVEKLSSLKEAPADLSLMPSMCHPNDICIFCDRHDICISCDALDFCITVDYHFADEVVEPPE